MKIRTGFVSNSSSSSFILGFDKKPKSAEELSKMMFGAVEGWQNHEYNEGVKVLNIDAARSLFEQLDEPLTQKQAIETIQRGHFDGFPELSYHFPPEVKAIEDEYKKKYNEDIYQGRESKDKEKQKMWNKFHKLWQKHLKEQTDTVNKAAKKYFNEELKEKFKGKKMFYVSYSDDSSLGSHMEHSGVLLSIEGVPAIRISNH